MAVPEPGLSDQITPAGASRPIAITAPGVA